MTAIALTLDHRQKAHLRSNLVQSNFGDCLDADKRGNVLKELQREP